MESQKMEYVGFWIRFVANMIDGILWCIVMIPFVLFLSGFISLDGVGFLSSLADFAVSYSIPAIVTLLFWCNLQATPGKMAFSAKIVDAKTGEKPTKLQFVVRYVGYIVSALPLGIGFLWVAFDKRKQGFHDKIAGTVVIRPKNGSIDVEFEKCEN